MLERKATIEQKQLLERERIADERLTRQLEAQDARMDKQLSSLEKRAELSAKATATKAHQAASARTYEGLVNNIEQQYQTMLTAFAAKGQDVPVTMVKNLAKRQQQAKDQYDKLTAAGIAASPPPDLQQNLVVMSHTFGSDETVEAPLPLWVELTELRDQGLRDNHIKALAQKAGLAVPNPFSASELQTNLQDTKKLIKEFGG